MVKLNLPPKHSIKESMPSSKGHSVKGSKVSITSSVKNIENKPFSFNTLDVTTGEDSID